MEEERERHCAEHFFADDGIDMNPSVLKSTICQLLNKSGKFSKKVTISAKVKKLVLQRQKRKDNRATLVEGHHLKFAAYTIMRFLVVCA